MSVREVVCSSTDPGYETRQNYEVYGYIFNIGTDGGDPSFDRATCCKARHGVPFIVTESNTGPEQADAYRATYIISTLGNCYQNRKTHNPVGEPGRPRS